MKRETRSRGTDKMMVPPLDPYRHGTIRQMILRELSQVIRRPDYREKVGLKEEPLSKIGGKESWLFHAFLESVESFTELINKDLKKVHQDSMWALQNVKGNLDKLYKQTVESEKRLKAASTQYEAAIFKSIEEASEALNGAYQRLTAIDQNLVKMDSSLKAEIQTRLNAIAQKFEEIKDTISATLKENKERIAYLWQQLEDSEKRVKDATATAERNLLTGMEQISATVEAVQARVLEMKASMDQMREDLRSDMVQVGNELMEAIQENHSLLEEIQAHDVEFHQDILKGVKSANDLGSQANEGISAVGERVEAIESKLDAFIDEVNERLRSLLEEVGSKLEANLKDNEKLITKESEAIKNMLTAVKGDLEVQKHIVLDALKSRR